MKSIFDAEFKKYGKLVEGYDLAGLNEILQDMPMPKDGVEYIPSQEALEDLPIYKELSAGFFGGMPIQIGSCCGKNSKLNCLEYHRDSELNYFTADVILMLGKLEDIVDGQYNSNNVDLFVAPAGNLIELYATTLHYCPANIHRDGFKAACVLPRGTNTENNGFVPKTDEDNLLFMKNKWIIAHPDAPEASMGVKVGIIGDNITV